MNNPKVYQALSVLGFVVSAVFTVKLFASNSTDIVSWLAMVATALLYEFGKYILLYQGLKGPFGQTGKTIMLGCWLLVTTASIVASATYVLNDANRNKNMMVENSSAFAKQQNSIKVQNDLYSTTKQQIEDLKALQTKQQQEGQAIVNAMPSNYIDRKNQQRASTQALAQKTQEQINQANNKLLEIAQGINKPEKLVISEESTTGGDSFFKLVAEKLNENPQNKNSPYSTEQVGIFFYIAVGIGLELLANLFAFLSQYYAHNKTLTTPSNNPEPKIKFKIPRPRSESSENKEIREIESGRLQGLKFNKDNITIFKPKKPTVSENSKVGEPDIQKYIDFVMANQKGGLAPGRNKIVQGVGFSQEKCRTIHNILIDRGILETGDKCTRIREVV